MSFEVSCVFRDELSARISLKRAVDNVFEAGPSEKPLKQADLPAFWSRTNGFERLYTGRTQQ